MEGIPFIEFGEAHVIETHEMKSGRRILETYSKAYPRT
jgi:hypothetical protein